MCKCLIVRRLSFLEVTFVFRIDLIKIIRRSNDIAIYEWTGAGSAEGSFDLDWMITRC